MIGFKMLLFTECYGRGFADIKVILRATYHSGHLADVMSLKDQVKFLRKRLLAHLEAQRSREPRERQLGRGREQTGGLSLNGMDSGCVLHTAKLAMGSSSTRTFSRCIHGQTHFLAFLEGSGSVTDFWPVECECE